MNREGIFVNGYYTGCKSRSYKGKDGSDKMSYEVGILISDTDSLTVQVEKDVSAEHNRFDYVVLKINSMRAYNNNLYMIGEFTDTSAEDL